MNVGRTVESQPVDSEEYFENLPKPFSFLIVEEKISYRHIAEWARCEPEVG
jgi:hypothetical protein